MTFAIALTMKRLANGCLCAGVLAAVGCADGGVGPTSPSAAAASSSLASTAPQSRELHVTKECSEYTGAAGAFCTVTSSNVAQIKVGSKIVYAQAAGLASLDSDIVLETPGPDPNRALGHCALDFATGQGLCTLSGGTGRFTLFSARVDVSYAGGPNWSWDGTYSLNTHE